MLISIPKLVFLKFQPKPIFGANLSRKSRIVYPVWKLTQNVYRGYDCKDNEEGLEEKTKMNNCIKCLLLFIFLLKLTVNFESIQECWVNGIIEIIKIFHIEKALLQPNFETRSKLHINLYKTGIWTQLLINCRNFLCLFLA